MYYKDVSRHCGFIEGIIPLHRPPIELSPIIKIYMRGLLKTSDPEFVGFVLFTLIVTVIFALLLKAGV